MVRIRAGGLTGYGESPPLPTFTGLDAAATAEGLKEAAGRIVGRTPEEALARLHAAPTLTGPGPLRSGRGASRPDRQARKRSRRPAVGPRRQASIRISRALGFHEPDALSPPGLGYLDQGVTAFKVKVGRDLATDVAAIAAVRRVAGEACELAIDANESSALATPSRWPERCALLASRTSSSPSQRDDIDGLRAVRATGLPVMADESVFDVADVARLASEGAVDLIAIKLIKCGGLAPAMDISGPAAHKLRRHGHRSAGKRHQPSRRAGGGRHDRAARLRPRPQRRVRRSTRLSPPCQGRSADGSHPSEAPGLGARVRWPTEAGGGA